MPKARIANRVRSKLSDLKERKNNVVSDPSDYIIFEDKDDEDDDEPQQQQQTKEPKELKESKEPKEPKESNMHDSEKYASLHPSEIYKEIQYMKVLLDEFKAAKTAKTQRLEQKNKERAELKAKKEKEKADRKLAKEKEAADYKKYLESLILDGKVKQEQKYKANVQQLLHQARRATLQF